MKRLIAYSSSPTLFLTSIILLFLIFLLSSDSFARVDKTGNWNFNETTGLVNIPTARTIEPRSIKLSVRMAKMGKKAPLKRRNDSSSPGPSTGTPLDSDWWIDNDGDRQLLISPFKNIELSLMNLHSYTWAPSVGMKWVAVNETKSSPAIAIGVHNAGGLREDSNVKNKEVRDVNGKLAPFIVATKSLFPEKWLDLSVGFGGGRFRNRIFYGGEAFLDKRKIWSIVGEYDGNIYSYGLKVRPYKSRWDFGAFIQDVDSPGVTINYTIKY